MEQSNLNPELEEMRKRILREEMMKQKRIEAAANEMVESLSRIHASFLFLKDSEGTLQKFCTILSATPANIHSNSWNALALGLGFSMHQVECIRNTCKEDFTLVVLQSYATRTEATLGEIVNVLRQIKRLDAFSVIKNDLAALAAKYFDDRSNEDSGFSSVEGSNEASIRLVYPPGYLTRIMSDLKSGLPITVRPLRKRTEREETSRHHEVTRTRYREEVKLVNAAPTHKPMTPRHNVFLTFGEDGAGLAKTIAKIFRTQNGKRPPIGVLMLEEQATVKFNEKLIGNPQRFITHMFDKVNYVIPILTEGYMDALVVSDNHDNLTTSMDAKYVQFIHDLASKYYVGNSCLNDKIRCIVPIEKRSILSHKHRKLDPIMKAYVYDTDVEVLARTITRTFNEEDD